MSKTAHITTRSVRHNGDLYPKNSVIHLTEEDADHLVAHGAVTPASEVLIAPGSLDIDEGPQTVDELISFAKAKFGVTLIVKAAGEPKLSSEKLATSVADFENKNSGLADPALMTREELLAEAALRDLRLAGNIGTEKARIAVIEARAVRAAAETV